MNAEPLARPTTPWSALTLQPKTPGLSHLDNVDYQETSHYPLQQERDAPGITPGPATSASISSLLVSATRCCTLSAAKSKACLQRRVPWYNYASTNKGMIRCRSGPCCTAQGESEKELGEMSTPRQLGIPSRGCCTGRQLAPWGRELPKNTSIVQYCSYPMVHRAWSRCLDAMQDGTLRGLHQPAMVVTSACCLGSGHSKCNCRLHLPDSSLYHQFYCISQNQF